MPADRAEAVIAAAERLVAKQRAMVAAVRGGRSVVEVMHDREFEAAYLLRGHDGMSGRHLIAAFEGLPTAAVSDALDKLGLPGSAHGIAAIFPRRAADRSRLHDRLRTGLADRAGDGGRLYR